MFTLIAQFVEFFRGAAGRRDHAADLMEDAGALAGLDPHQAQELREAASAYLRVVR